MWLKELAPQDLVVVFTASLLALAVLLVFAARRQVGHEKDNAKSHEAEIAFLFHDGRLLDGTPSAFKLLDVSDPQGSDLDRVFRALSRRYPSLRQVYEGLGRGDMARVEAHVEAGEEGAVVSMARLNEDEVRLRIEDPETPDTPDPNAGYVIDALQDAVLMHRGLTEGIGFPMWRQTANGKITWVNAEYSTLEQALAAPPSGQGDRAGTPCARDHSAADPQDGPEARQHLFADQIDLGGDLQRIQRGKLELPGENAPRWYEFQTSLLHGDLLVTAVPVDRVVQAERSLSGFVQTLTQTFAHLNVGLAIFNRSRELVIFNPALSELTDLSPEFLVTRPSLNQVFDRMREKRMVPEHKDYKAWRKNMSAIEDAALGSILSETWSLMDGRTFRVTGRPHPEGAVAFLFEDISNEISLERRFRSELQMGQSVLDGLSEAIAVFTPSGAMTMSNRAYRELWYNTSEPGDLPKTFVDATRAWQSLALPTPIWGDARDFSATLGERENWSAEAQMTDGRVLLCRFEALSGGYTLAAFSAVASEPAASSASHVEQQSRMSA